MDVSVSYRDIVLNHFATFEDMRIVQGIKAVSAPTRAKEGRHMRHFHGETRIEAPVELVWELFIDRSRLHEWTPRSEFTSFSGPLDQVGTTYSDTTRLMGLDFKMTNEVVEVEPLRLYHEHTDTGPVDTVLRLQPDGDATRVVVDADYDIAFRLPGFIKDFLIKHWGEPNARQMMHKLKTLCETEARAKA